MLKPEWKNQYAKTARVFGLNIDNYNTEEAFELALRGVINQKKEEKFAFTEENIPYVDRAVKLAKGILPSVTDARECPREELKKHILDNIRRNEEFYQYCIEHRLDADKIKAIAAEETRNDPNK